MVWKQPITSSIAILLHIVHTEWNNHFMEVKMGVNFHIHISHKNNLPGRLDNGCVQLVADHNVICFRNLYKKTKNMSNSCKWDRGRDGEGEMMTWLFFVSQILRKIASFVIWIQQKYCTGYKKVIHTKWWYVVYQN